MSRHRAPTTRLRWIPATAAVGGAAVLLGTLLWPTPAPEPLPAVQADEPAPPDLLRASIPWTTR